MEHHEVIGRAFIRDGWRAIYSARVIKRGRFKGWYEVTYIGLRKGQPTYIKTRVNNYRKGDNVYDRANDNTEGHRQISLSH